MIVEGPGSLGERFRIRRWSLVERHFPDLERMRVLDLGGTVRAWRRAPVVPKHVTVLNLHLHPFEMGEEHSRPSWIDVREGDACAPPADILEQRWDLVFCNSLIEHVGGYARRHQLADIVRTLGDAYWVQTPYRYFPVEPHFLFPLFQFLPLAARREILRRWPLVHTRPRSKRQATNVALETELIGRGEMRHLFPDGRLIGERVGPLVKSLIAVRTRVDMENER